MHQKIKQYPNRLYKDPGVIPMYNVMEYSENYSKTSERLWQYYGDEPNATETNSESFKAKVKIIRKAPAAGNTTDAKIAVRLKYLNNF